MPSTSIGTTVPPHPSATVVMLRDGDAGLEILYLRRNSRLAFHGGAWVFPGGRIDAGDHAGGHAIEDVARRAAVREAREESGLDVSPETLVHFASWTTPEGMPKRFETWFFAARAGEGDVQVDGGEIHAHRWLRPADALAAHAAGEIELPPPTFVTTLALERRDDMAGALAAWQDARPVRFLPRIHKVASGLCSLYEEDAGYADGDVERAGTRHRLWIDGSRLRYERSDESLGLP